MGRSNSLLSTGQWSNWSDRYDPHLFCQNSNQGKVVRAAPWGWQSHTADVQYSEASH